MEGFDLNALIRTLDNTTQAFTIADVLLTIVLSFELTLVIAWTYKITHHGNSYSQTCGLSSSPSPDLSSARVWSSSHSI